MTGMYSRRATPAAIARDAEDVDKVLRDRARRLTPPPETTWCDACQRYTDVSGHRCAGHDDRMSLDDVGEVERWDPWDRPDIDVSFL